MTLAPPQVDYSEEEDEISDGSYESMDELDYSEMLNVVPNESKQADGKTSPFSEVFRRAYAMFVD